MRRPRRGLALACAAAGLLDAGAAAASCLPYEPAQVVLVGRMHAVEGDDGAPPTTTLRLDRAACIQAGSGQPGAPRVREVRLVFPRGSRALEGWSGRKLAVSGSLFRSVQGRREPQVSLLVTGLGRVR